MHPFCCVFTVSDSNNHSSNNKPFVDRFPSIPPPSTNMTTTSGRTEVPARSTAVQLNNHHNNHIINGGSGSTGNSSWTEGSLRLSNRAEPVDVKINDIVGNGIAGVLQKWVNYGKGWRPRWFVLHDGVLSYYKIHGPDKIVVSEETERGYKIIGDESIRRIAKHKNKKFDAAQHNLNRKPFGEVHLKVFYPLDLHFCDFKCALNLT